MFPVYSYSRWQRQQIQENFITLFTPGQQKLRQLPSRLASDLLIFDLPPSCLQACKLRSPARSSTCSTPQPLDSTHSFGWAQLGLMSLSTASCLLSVGVSLHCLPSESPSAASGIDMFFLLGIPPKWFCLFILPSSHSLPPLGSETTHLCLPAPLLFSP